jgi:multidrug transporter EmrE-like cation transporter
MTAIILYFIVIFTNILGNYFYKILSKTIALEQMSISLVSKLILNKWFFLGTLSFAVAMPSLVLLLARQKISVAYPIITGVVFLVVAVCGAIFFKEHLSFIQLVGIFTILLGLILMTQ